MSPSEHQVQAPIGAVTLLDYQEQAARWLARTGKGMVVSPAGSGKTIIIAAALWFVIQMRRRTARVRCGWLAATIEQCQQAKDAIGKFPGLADSIELTVGRAAGMPVDGVYDVLIVDECHHAPAATWAAIIRRHAGCLWLATATPFGDDLDRNAELLSMVKGHVYTVPRSAVAARVVPAFVVMLDDTDEGLQEPIDAEIKRLVAERERFSRISRDEIYRNTAPQVCMELGIVPNRARNEAIARTAIRHAAESVLIIVGSIAHGEVLQAQIPGSARAFSKMGKKRRREVIEAFKVGKLRCLIASSVADEGLDVPAANCLVLAGAGRSAARVEQRAGRVLRAHGEKTHGTIYDFLDRQHPLLERQSIARQSVYRRLGYRFSNAQPAHQPALACL